MPSHGHLDPSLVDPVSNRAGLPTGMFGSFADVHRDSAFRVKGRWAEVASALDGLPNEVHAMLQVVLLGNNRAVRQVLVRLFCARVKYRRQRFTDAVHTVKRVVHVQPEVSQGQEHDSSRSWEGRRHTQQSFAQYWAGASAPGRKAQPPRES